MNTSDLKAYAPKARKDFIAAVTRRAELLGLNPAHPGTVEQQGDVLLINGQAYPARIANQRARLATRIAQQGFAVVMEALAYTWFNRLVAIRYMELHGYLDHGYRVLSHLDGGSQPEILEHLVHLELPGLDRQQALEWKAAGNRDEDLYRAVLLAQCHALHAAMPFLFEAIDDATELLLPDGLLRTDSPIRTLVTAIEDASWQDVEIIGWLYQFYISEKKDQVIGKVVKSEDIPAATQLFTPNWIVKYMVQNSLGAQWLATYPDSGLKAQMAYYIEPAEQTDEVKAQLAAITPASLDPEALTLIDPACGSGHILAEAYELFKAIYLERGYALRDVAKLILEKNLYGLDIDERAAQLTGFALMMKARADDRRLFERGVQLNVMALQDSTGFDAERLAQGVKLADYGLRLGDLEALKALFEHATTFGSLIQVPEALAAKLPALRRLSETDGRDLFVRGELGQLKVLVRQAEMLVMRYHSVAANPPYMGGRGGMNAVLKDYAERTFVSGKADLFGAFIEQCGSLTRVHGYLAMITMESWMFLPSYKDLRPLLLDNFAAWSMLHLGSRAFDTISGEIVRTTAFSMQKGPIPKVNGSYRRLVSGKNEAEKIALLRKPGSLHYFNAGDIRRIPESRWAYWLSDAVLRCFDSGQSLESCAPVRQGFQTGDNDRFLRFWHEINVSTMEQNASCKEDVFNRNKKWVPYNKGGDFCKWYGNNEYVVAFDKQNYELLLVSGNCLPSRNLYFRESVTWSAMGSTFGARLSPIGFTFSAKGACCFPETKSAAFVTALLTARVSAAMFEFLAPTLDFNVGAIRQIPLPSMTPEDESDVENIAIKLIFSARRDWDLHEVSWDFQGLSLLPLSEMLESSYEAWIIDNRAAVTDAKHLEERNNSLFIDAYGLQDELTPEVPIEQITLTVNPAYRYGGKLSEEEQWTRFREDTMLELVSYVIGCMMGRYSLDAPGLIYAHSGNEGFDASRYTRFPADEDGIVPITDVEWFDDDACTRVVEFISVAWDASQLEANLQFLASNLSPKKGEASRGTIRRYLCDRFFKDHLQTYKKRPIYWLFSSGKEQAFQCLVYLHRYNAGTLSRMRMEYVVPLQSRMQARIDKLADDLASASSSAQSKQLQKQKDNTQKKLEELRRFDEKLRHYADQRITLDLDDGVKVNYGKFGDLLAEVKAVTGGDSED